MNATTRVTTALMLGLSLAAAGPVFAANGQSGQSQGMSQQQSLPSSSDISDSQLQTFVKAKNDVQQVRQNWMSKLKNADSKKDAMSKRRQATKQMMSAVKDDGMTVQQYNQIARAAQSDKKLAQRISSME